MITQFTRTRFKISYTMVPPLVKTNPHLYSTSNSSVSHLLPTKRYDDGDIIGWCNEHNLKFIISDDSDYPYDIFKFDEEDAFLFKLRWL
jgi:flavorubredoxin